MVVVCLDKPVIPKCTWRYTLRNDTVVVHCSSRKTSEIDFSGREISANDLGKALLASLRYCRLAAMYDSLGLMKSCCENK